MVRKFTSASWLNFTCFKLCLFFFQPPCTAVKIMSLTSWLLLQWVLTGYCYVLPSCIFSRMNMCSFLTFSSQGKCSSPWPSWWLSCKLVPVYQCLVLWQQLDRAFRYGVKMLSRGNNHSPWATSYGPVQMVQDRAGLLCCKTHCGLMLSSMSANTSRPCRKAAPQSVSLQCGLPSHVWDSTSVLAKFHQVTVAHSFKLYRSLWMAALTSSLLTVSSSLVLSANLASLFLFIQYSFFWVH